MGKDDKKSKEKSATMSKKDASQSGNDGDSDLEEEQIKVRNKLWYNACSRRLVVYCQVTLLSGSPEFTQLITLTVILI